VSNRSLLCMSARLTTAGATVAAPRSERGIFLQVPPARDQLFEAFGEAGSARIELCSCRVVMAGTIEPSKFSYGSILMSVRV